MSLEKRWREQAKAIREKARPLVTRVDEIKEAMKHASEFNQEPLMAELRQLTQQIGKLAREAANCDSMALGQIGGLR